MEKKHDSIGDTLAPWGTFAFRLLLSIDQLINVLLLGFPDESISGRLGRAHQSTRPKWFARYGKRFVDWLFHCLFGNQEMTTPQISYKMLQ